MHWCTRQRKSFHEAVRQVALSVVGVLGCVGALGCGGGAPPNPLDQGSDGSEMGLTDGAMAGDFGAADMGDVDGALLDTGSSPDCPVLAGTYSVATQGPGCTGVGASQVIEQFGPGGCTLAFMTPDVLNGDVNVDNDGSFIGQTLTLSLASRTCRGSWNSALEQYTVVCGFDQTACILTLD